MTPQLTNIKVLDLSSVVVGPVCTWRLAQYGAEVIKVEAPEGDLMRGLGGLSPTGQHSGTFLHLNRGKRNIELDLKSLEAAAVLDALLDWADVVVTNMRPEALKRLGLDADTIRARYPTLVHCTITGFGSSGPYAGAPAYDSVVQGAAGIPGLFIERDGAPAYVPLLICDHIVGEIAAGAVLAAVLRRQTTGNGASIEVPMFETMAAFVLQEHMAQMSFDPPVGPAGDQRLLNPFNKPLQTADGWISVTANTDNQVRAFLSAVGKAELLEDPRFRTVADRARNVREWFAVRGASLTSRTTAEWLDIFKNADVAAMPCHTPESLIADKHLNEVGFFLEEIHPTEGKCIGFRSSILVDNKPLPAGNSAEPKGQSTIDILESLGLTSNVHADLQSVVGSFRNKT